MVKNIRTATAAKSNNTFEVALMKRFVLSLIAVVCLMGSVRAQVFQFGVKLQYASKSVIELRNEVFYDVQHNATRFIKDSELGLLARFNIWRFSIQPEANFSIASVWDSVDNEDNFFDRCGEAFKNLETVNMSIPVLVGFKLFDVNDFFEMRLFAGPEFYATIKGIQDKGFDVSNYSFVAGMGFDLLDLFYIDARYSRYSKGENYYRLGIGFVF